MKMKTFMFSVLCGVVWISVAKESPPVVKVYTKTPGVMGQPNTLVCYLSDFQPPVVDVHLLKDGVEIPGAKLSDLMFEQNWQYHIIKTANFTPQSGAQYSCRVTHVGTTNTYNWDIDG